MSTQGAISSFNRPGWLMFAAWVMFAVGIMQAISGIYFLANSQRIANVSGGAFGHHTVVLGIWELIIAALSACGPCLARRGVIVHKGREGAPGGWMCGRAGRPCL